MLPWNRKEVFVNSSFQDFCKAREVLSQNHIKNTCRTVNRNQLRQIIGRSPSVTSFVPSAENMDFNCMYYIYVSRNDYEAACFELHK